MADAARLIEQPHAQNMLLVEGSTACLLRPRALRRQRERDHAGAQSDCHPSHPASSRTSAAFLVSLRPRGRQGKRALRRRCSALTAGLDTPAAASATNIGSAISPKGPGFLSLPSRSAPPRPPPPSIAQPPPPK